MFCPDFSSRSGEPERVWMSLNDSTTGECLVADLAKHVVCCAVHLDVRVERLVRISGFRSGKGVLKKDVVF
jgi:hypothetical protein